MKRKSRRLAVLGSILLLAPGLLRPCTSFVFQKQTKNPPPDERPPLRSAFWLQHLLDTCATVEEVAASERAVRMSETVDHYLAADASGDVAAVEFLEGRAVVHFRSSRNMERRSIDLHKLDFACGQPVGMLDVHAPLRGDISAAFKPYDPEAGVAFTLRFLKESRIAFPEEQIRALLKALESFPCK